MNINAVNDYVRRLRNPAKRTYALKYALWRIRGGLGQEPERGELGAMGAQAVRLDIGVILNAV